MLHRLFPERGPKPEHLEAMRRQQAIATKLSKKIGIPPDKLLDYRALNGILHK